MIPGIDWHTGSLARRSLRGRRASGLSVSAALLTGFVAACTDAGSNPSSNREPVASIVLFPNSIPEGDANQTVVVLDGSGSQDPDGDPITFSWDVPGGTFGPESGPSDATPQVTYPGTGRATVTLTVRDDRGGVGQASASVAVEDSPLINRPPVAAIVQFPTSIPEDDFHNTVVSADAKPSFDADGDSLTYRWDVPEGTYVNGTTVTDRTIQVTFPGSHPHTIKLTVDDGHGGTAQDSVIIIVL